MGDRPGRDATLIQEGECCSPCIILSAAGIVEEHGCDLHSGGVFAGADPTMGAAYDDMTGIIRMDVSDRVDHHDPAEPVLFQHPSPHLKGLRTHQTLA
jgi:hypothetical protein